MQDSVPYVKYVNVAPNELFNKYTVNRNLRKLFLNDAYLSAQTTDYNIKVYSSSVAFAKGDLVWYKVSDTAQNIYLLVSLVDNNKFTPSHQTAGDYTYVVSDSHWQVYAAEGNLSGLNSFDLANLYLVQSQQLLSTVHETDQTYHTHGKLGRSDSNVLYNTLENISPDRDNFLYPYQTIPILSGDVITSGHIRKWPNGILEYDLVYRLGVVSGDANEQLLSANTASFGLRGNNSYYFNDDQDYGIFSKTSQAAPLQVNGLVQKRFANITSKQNVYSADIPLQEQFADLDYAVFGSAVKCVETDIGKADEFDPYAEELNALSISRLGRRIIGYDPNFSYGKTLSLPDGITDIGDSAFQGLRSSAKGGITMQFSQTASLRNVGQYAFKDSDFKRIDFPPALQHIGVGAFDGCNKLKELHFYVDKTDEAHQCKLPTLVFADASDCQIYIHELGPVMALATSPYDDTILNADKSLYARLTTSYAYYGLASASNIHRETASVAVAPLMCAAAPAPNSASADSMVTVSPAELLAKVKPARMMAFAAAPTADPFEYQGEELPVVPADAAKEDITDPIDLSGVQCAWNELSGNLPASIAAMAESLAGEEYIVDLSSYNISAVASSALLGVSAVNRLILPNTIQSLGDFSLSGMADLSVLEFEDKAPQLSSIGESVFAKLPSLQSIALFSNTSLSVGTGSIVDTSISALELGYVEVLSTGALSDNHNLTDVLLHGSAISAPTVYADAIVGSQVSSIRLDGHSWILSAGALSATSAAQLSLNLSGGGYVGVDAIPSACTSLSIYGVSAAVELDAGGQVAYGIETSAFSGLGAPLSLHFLDLEDDSSVDATLRYPNRNRLRLADGSTIKFGTAGKTLNVVDGKISDGKIGDKEQVIYPTVLSGIACANNKIISVDVDAAAAIAASLPEGEQYVVDLRGYYLSSSETSALYGFSQLNQLYLPDCMADIGVSAFSKMANLSAFEVDGEWKSVSSVGAYGISELPLIQQLDLSKSPDTVLTQHLVVRDGITKLRLPAVGTLGSNTIYGNQDLYDLELSSADDQPSEIQTGAIADCQSLSSISFVGSGWTLDTGALTALPLTSLDLDIGDGGRLYEQSLPATATQVNIISALQSYAVETEPGVYVYGLAEGLFKNATSPIDLMFEGLDGVGQLRETLYGSNQNRLALPDDSSITFGSSADKYRIIDGKIVAIESYLVIDGPSVITCDFTKMIVVDEDTGLTSYMSDERVNIPNGISAIMPNAFYTGDTRQRQIITNIKIPATMKYIGEGAFRNNILLNTLDFTKGTELDYIGPDVLKDCASLNDFIVRRA